MDDNHNNNNAVADNGEDQELFAFRIVEESRVPSLNGIPVSERERIDLSAYASAGWPSVQLQVRTNDDVVAVGTVSLDKLLYNNSLKLDSTNQEAQLSLLFAWQEELPPGLTLGRHPAKNILDYFPSQQACFEEFDKWQKKHDSSLKSTYLSPTESISGSTCTDSLCASLY